MRKGHADKSQVSVANITIVRELLGSNDLQYFIITILNFALATLLFAQKPQNLTQVLVKWQTAFAFRE